ncbi:hypothetical protein RB25_26140, partial [Herbaspirillum rubrisubalbicans]
DSLSPVISALFGPGLSQHARLITLDSAQPDGLPESLVVERFHGQESVNDNFHFDIDALSVSTDLDLKQFIGTELTLRLLLESFLAFLERRHDSFLFQDMDVTEIASALFKEYPQAN